MATFRKAEWLFVTAALLGGYHHVNVRKREYWVGVFESYGFTYMAGFEHIKKCGYVSNIARFSSTPKPAPRPNCWKKPSPTHRGLGGS